MGKLHEKLVADRAVKYEKLEAMITAAEAEDRDLDEPEAEEFRSIEKELETLDKRITEVRESEERMAKAAAVGVHVEGVKINREPLQYRSDADHSYFSDLYKSSRGDFEAIQRLQRHSLEMRDLNRTDGTGGTFVPPLHLVDEFTAFARAGRVTADLCNVQPLPRGTDSINIPRITGGTTTAVQTADNAGVSETDLTDALSTAPVRTIAGQQDVAIQLLDQSPVAFDRVVMADLMADYAKKLDDQVLNGSGASGQVTGIRNVSGINSVTYADTTPTAAELYKKLADAVQRVYTGRFMPPTAWVLHPRRWAFLLAESDSTNRPLIVPAAQGPQNALAQFGANAAEGPVGGLLGIPVYIDANIPTNLGVGTNEDVIILARFVDLWLWEGQLRSRMLPDVLSGTLTVRLQMYNYLAFNSDRYPAAISTVTGTGLVAPLFT